MSITIFELHIQLLPKMRLKAVMKLLGFLRKIGSYEKKQRKIDKVTESFYLLSFYFDYRHLMLLVAMIFENLWLKLAKLKLLIENVWYENEDFMSKN